MKNKTNKNQNGKKKSNKKKKTKKKRTKKGEKKKQTQTTNKREVAGLSGFSSDLLTSIFMFGGGGGAVDKTDITLDRFPKKFLA